MVGTSYADPAWWGIPILDRTAGVRPFLAYTNRLGDRSIADVLSRLWKVWINGVIKIRDDADQTPRNDAVKHCRNGLLTLGEGCITKQVRSGMATAQA